MLSYLRHGGNVSAYVCLYVCQQDNEKLSTSFDENVSRASSTCEWKWLVAGDDLITKWILELLTE